MAGFHVENFGCRAARADGEAMREILLSSGHCMQQPSDAAVVVVNTCSVTAEADRAARAFIRKAHRENPEAKIVVTGCYAQRAPGELAEMAGVAAVVGNSHKALAPEIIAGLAQVPTEAAAVSSPMVSVDSLLSAGHRAPVWVDDRFAHSFLEEAQVIPGSQTRPNLKIQEGCGNRCTFCVIPQTRGHSRSLPAASVLRQVERFVAAGGNELVLSGINLGRWGRDFTRVDLASCDSVSSCFPGSPSARDLGAPPSVAGTRMTSGKNGAATSVRGTLAGLVREIIETTGLPRLRLSSIEPMDWDAELIDLMAEFGGASQSGGRLARHAHLPLQSGSDAVLRRMHRRYRPWHYADKVAALFKAAGPELTLGADVMVGFPGETDAEFKETLAMVRSLPFGYLHLFPFSPRPGTRGWALHAESPVPPRIVEERMATLRAVAAEKSQEHRRCFIGRELEAITLHTPPSLAARGQTFALTENFLPVELTGTIAANNLLRVRVTGFTGEGSLAALPVSGIEISTERRQCRFEQSQFL